MARHGFSSLTAAVTSSRGRVRNASSAAVRIEAQRRQHAQMQRQGDHQAAGGGEGMFGAPGADQGWQRPAQGRARLQRHAVGGGWPVERSEDAMNLRRLTRLRCDDDDGIAEIERRIELLRQRDRNGLDAESAILDLGHPVDGMGTADAQQDGAPAQAQRVGDAGGQVGRSCRRTPAHPRAGAPSRDRSPARLRP